MDPYQPTIPAKVRDAAYIGGLVTTAATGLAVTVVSVVVPEVAGQAAQIGTAILSAVGLIVSGLGVAYRPGAQHDYR